MRPGGGWSAAKPKKGGCVPLSALLLAQGSLVARPNALPIGLARPEERGRIHLVKTTPRPPTGAATPTVLRHQKRLNWLACWCLFSCLFCFGVSRVSTLGTFWETIITDLLLISIYSWFNCDILQIVHIHMFVEIDYFLYRAKAAGSGPRLVCWKTEVAECWNVLMPNTKESESKVSGCIGNAALVVLKLCCLTSGFKSPALCRGQPNPAGWAARYK